MPNRERTKLPEGFHTWTEEQREFYMTHGYEMPTRSTGARLPRFKGKRKTGLAALEPMPDINSLRKGFDKSFLYDETGMRGDPSTETPRTGMAEIMQDVEGILTQQGGDITDIVVKLASDKWHENRRIRFNELVKIEGYDPERVRSELNKEMPWPFDKYGYFPPEENIAPEEEGIQVPAIEESIFGDDDLG
jgi:hypothetical protein